MDQILRAEATLTAARVPPRFWIYVSANRDPAYEPDLDDRRGCWGDTRASTIQDAIKYPTLYRTVVDGRNYATIEHIIHASWQGDGVFRRVEGGGMREYTPEDVMNDWREWLAKAMEESAS